MKRLGLHIPKPEHARRFAVGDIHGCRATFKKLVENKISLTKNDHLYLLGDYIDRGPDSKGVIDYIIQLQLEGNRVYPLRGNHEHDLLAYTKEVPEVLKWVLKRSRMLDLLDGDGLKPVYQNFLETLPFYLDIGDFYLVHAGLNRRENTFTDTSCMLQLRYFEGNGKLLQGRRIVHGHDVRDIHTIRRKVSEACSVIPIDNGAVYAPYKKHKIHDLTGLGKLCALNLDTFELLEQDFIPE